VARRAGVCISVSSVTLDACYIGDMSETYQEGKDREERERIARIEEATEKAKAQNKADDGDKKGKKKTDEQQSQ
jgi:hypothetical protein